MKNNPKKINLTIGYVGFYLLLSQFRHRMAMVTVCVCVSQCVGVGWGVVVPLCPLPVRRWALFLSRERKTWRLRTTGNALPGARFLLSVSINQRCGYGYWHMVTCSASFLVFSPYGIAP